ncbi:zinc transporter, ZIP family [Lachnospiraceae bacterium XBB1006]|nr:zinc transporter, ZIP family [Lachnospiraceae bacterium XBB1006]
MWKIIMIPFLGTSLGAASVFFLKKDMKEGTKRALSGFTAGVMVAASFFSLLAPAVEQAEAGYALPFLPVSVGFAVGMLFLLLLDVVVPHMHLDRSEEGVQSGLRKTTKLVLAVTLHNLPEGMAVGIVCAGWMYGGDKISMMSAMSLALGIAIQNFPEGAIVSVPLLAEKKGDKMRTFLYGVLSGAVEPLGALGILFAAGFFLPMMPYLLSFAAGAMMYVVVEELIPEMVSETHSNVGTLSFAMGFIVMMILDMQFG